MPTIREAPSAPRGVGKRIVTHSRLKSTRACFRQAHYAYGLGIRPVLVALALSFGTAIHHALEAYWRARMEGRRDEAIRAALAAIAEDVRDPYVLARAAAMLAAYFTVWHARDVQVLAVERVFSLPLLDPHGRQYKDWERGGKIDLVLRLEDDRVAITEHKTSAEDIAPGGMYRAKLALEGQASQYVHGAAALGFDADIVVWDVLVKPKHRPRRATPVEKRKYTQAKPERPATKKSPARPAEPSRLAANQRERDETPEEYQARVMAEVLADPTAWCVQVEVPRLAVELDAYAEDVWHYARLVDATDAAGAWPRNTDACHRYGSTCPYLPVCEGRASIDDPTLYRVAGDVHEELVVPPDAADEPDEQ